MVINFGFDLGKERFSGGHARDEVPVTRKVKILLRYAFFGQENYALWTFTPCIVTRCFFAFPPELTFLSKKFRHSGLKWNLQIVFCGQLRLLSEWDGWGYWAAYQAGVHQPGFETFLCSLKKNFNFLTRRS